MKDQYAENPHKGYDNKEAENKAKADRTEQEEQLDDSLRDQGLDREQAAGIANAENIGYGSGESHVYDNMSMEELYEEAKKKNIDGYYNMRRNDIVNALKQMRSED